MAFKQALPTYTPELITKPTCEERHTAYEQKPKDKYHVELKIQVNKSYKQRNNTWSAMKAEKEPITVSKVIVANNEKQAKNIAINSVVDITDMEDTYYVSECGGSITVSSFFIEDGGQPSAPSGMMMREAHHVNYNNITECKLYDKKVGMCVIDNFLGVYSPYIKKLTREKFIAECEF